MSAMRGDVLAAIQRLTEEKGFAPSIREIGDAVGLSSSATVHFHLAALKAAGKIDYESQKPRTVRLVQ